MFFVGTDPDFEVLLDRLLITIPTSTPIFHSATLNSYFYGLLSSPNFQELHGYLLTLANTTNPQIEYVFRSIRDMTKFGWLRRFSI
jgi:hypothetical protein